MSLLDRLREPAVWEAFYAYKTGLACPKQFAKELRAFIDAEGWRPVCEAIERGEPFPLPRRAVISKLSSGKKRVVYTYPRAENTVLKLLTWLLLRHYDGLFSRCLWSFRPGRTAKDAVRSLLRSPGIWKLFSYKADIHDYFNSIPVERLLPLLRRAVGEDEALFAFLSRLLTEPMVLADGEHLTEQKGIMAGTPLSAFYANLYLAELDRRFAEAGVPYARYSDDIILFVPSREEAEDQAAFLRDFLKEQGLAINPEKEFYSAPGEGWTFLGFLCREGVIDVAPVTVKKLKAKMRRKARSLQRWRQRNGESGERAARAFIRVFRRKLLESPADHELSWSRWFFSVINTTESLAVIDRYAEDCLRYLLSGKRTKARYNVRYEELRALGWRSLVHAYYEYEKEERGG